jgi:hypothetical protein
VNGGVIGGQGAAEWGDACDVITGFAPDVVYLDPPYPGTTGYTSSYRLIDQLLGDESPTAATVKLDDLLEAARDVPIVVLSYGGPKVTLEGLVTQVQAHRQVTVSKAVPYKHLRSVSKGVIGARSNEFIIIAER